MLKILAIFAVIGPLAAIGVASSKTTPLSTQKQGIAEQNSGQNGGVQTKPKDSNDAAQNPPPRPAVKQTPAPTCDEICQQGRQNLDIQGKLKTFTGWLVVVGVVQAFALLGTIIVAFRQEIAPQDVIRANQSSAETYVVFFIPEKWGDDLVFMDRRIRIEMRGSVEYEDIFGDQHTTPLNYDMIIPKIVKWRGNNVAEVHPMAQWRKVVGAGGDRTT